MIFNYQKICKDLIKGLDQRTADIIERRFGLKGEKSETLEAIGSTYDITRERVRQIEVEGFSKIKSKLENNKNVFDYFQKSLIQFGKLKKEESLLEYLGGDKAKNHVFFLLTNAKEFSRIPEDDKLYSLWTIDNNAVNEARKVIKSTIERLEKEKRTLSLDDLLKKQKLNKDIFVSYIGISKDIQKSPEGNFGLANWLEINPKGIKDKAYLVLSKEEAPLHFAEVASRIEKLPFPGHNKIHTATVHNELIKDERFVLVGRGLYALKEWGYESGVVKDVILNTLKNSKKPLSKQEILEKVLAQRFVKENTVVLNLQNKNYFLRDSQGRYTIKQA
jgi:hypothetical protein